MSEFVKFISSRGLAPTFGAAFGLVALSLSWGCAANAPVDAANARPKAAFFRVANFTDGPVTLTINGLPLTGPVLVGQATAFTKTRVDRLTVQINGVDQKVPLEEPGMTMYLLGSHSKPRQVLIKNDIRKPEKDGALIRVVNLTEGDLTVNGPTIETATIAKLSATDPVVQGVGLGELEIKAGSVARKQDFDLQDGKSYVVIVTQGKSKSLQIATISTPEAMGVEATQAAAQGG